jgi:hypothetical protein
MESMQLIDIGTTPNDGTGDSLRTAGDKINDNFYLIGWKGDSVTSSASHTINTDTNNHYIVTAQGEDTAFAAPTGTPMQNQKLLIRIKDDGSARAISWNAAFRSIGAALPVTTVAGKTTYVGFIYNSTDAKWDCLAVGTEA